MADREIKKKIIAEFAIKKIKIGEYLGKLIARSCLPREFYAHGHHTAKNEQDMYIKYINIFCRSKNNYTVSQKNKTPNS